MAKKKLVRYEEIHNFPNVIYTEIVDAENRIVSRNWDERSFEKEQETVMEIGCGRGEYCIDLARRNPHKNYVGVDLKADRLYIGALKAKEEGLTNVMFVRIRVEYLIPFLQDQRLSEAWITFPDPHLCNENGKRRLTSPRFLEIYKRLVKPGGGIHLKTDDDTLYHFSMESIGNSPAEIIHATDNLYNEGFRHPELTDIQTTYEKRFLAESKTIKYINFSFQKP